MKNTIMICMALLVLTMSACKKDTAPNPGGSWTIKGRTFNTVSCIDVNGILTASSVASDSCSVLLSFGNGASIPTSSGTYRVVDGLNGDSSLVAISMYIGSFISFSSTNNGTVAVTVKNGKVNVVGNGVIMKNDNIAHDSTGFTFNIGQL